MGVLVEFQHFNVVQLDVQVLVDRLEDSANSDVILELDCDSLVGKGLEETVESISCRCNRDCDELGLT